MSISILDKADISKLESKVIENGKLKIMPYSFYKDIDDNALKLLMLKYGIYVLPTQELIDWLKENIKGTAIEIGAGTGAIGRALNIPITDNCMQEWPEIKMHYIMCGQPPIKYPDDIDRVEASAAIVKYKPETVIGCFITHKFNPKTNDGNAFGVDEDFLLERVDRYINVGNIYTHRNKPIFRLKPQEYKFDWLITRSVDQSLNRIWIFDKK